MLIIEYVEIEKGWFNCYLIYIIVRDRLDLYYIILCGSEFVENYLFCRILDFFFKFLVL